MEYRPIVPGDLAAFWRFLCALDRETAHMMYEPGEREARSGPEALRQALEPAFRGEDFLHIALEGGEIAGFLHAERGRFARCRHTAYLVAGVRRACRGQGVGTTLFRRLDRWAAENGVVRLELTVECRNEAARRLYEKSGFTVEGVRTASMRVRGALLDEFYMAKILSVPEKL